MDIVLRNLQYFPSTLQLTLIPTVFSPGGRARLFTHYNDRTSWNYSSFLTFAASAVLAIRGMELFLDFTLRRFILFVTVEFGANELGGESVSWCLDKCRFPEAAWNHILFIEKGQALHQAPTFRCFRCVLPVCRSVGYVGH